MDVDFFAEEVRRPGKYQGEEPYVPYFDQFDGKTGSRKMAFAGGASKKKTSLFFRNYAGVKG
jgi:hypothetical protein